MDFRSVDIEEHIKRQVESFVSRWNKKLAGFPILCLDYSWPSLGVIDLITFSLRYRFSLSEEQNLEFTSSIAYVACVLAKYKDPSSKPIRIYHDASNLICMNAFIEGREAEVEFEKIFFETFRDLKGMLPLSDNFRRPISYDSTLVSSLALSLLLNVSPLLDKKSRFNSKDLEKQRIGHYERQIALDVGSWFEKNFPKLEFCHVPELYLKGLIYPFLLMEEEPPLVSLTSSVLDYVNSLALGKSYFRDVIKSFSLCPDEQISGSAIALSGIFEMISDVPASVISTAKVRKYLTPLLRSAILNSASYTHKEPQNWIKNKLINDSSNFFDIELELGTLPWLAISKNWLAKEDNLKRVLPFLECIIDYQFSEGVKILEDLVSETPSEIELRIQQIKFEFIGGDYEKCHALCRSLVSEPRSENFASFFNLWGLVILNLGEPEVAARYFRAAKALKNTPALLKADILNNLGWANIEIGDFKKAKEDLLNAEVLSLCPVTIWLNLAFIAAQEGDEDTRRVYLNKAIGIAPCDRRVFSNFS